MRRHKIAFLIYMEVFPDGSGGKESASNTGNTGDMGQIPVSGRSAGGTKWEPTPVFLPEKSHGQKVLVGYSPWGHRVRHN